MPLGCVGLLSPVISDAFQQTWGRDSAARKINVLDCGMGNGMWGLACRQWLESKDMGREVYLMGVEVWDQYRGPAWQYYDWIHATTIENYLRNPRSRQDLFDVILLLDVIEHFETSRGMAVLEELRGRLKPGGVLYVGTPGCWIEQGAYKGNEHETHLSLWTADQFRVLGGEVLLDGSPCAQGYVMVLARFGKL